MEKSEAELFLTKHRSSIIAGVRNVESLLDFLSQSDVNKQSFLDNEMTSKIRAQRTKQEKMRELYQHLNCTRGYELTLTWLKKDEPDLTEDLEMSQTDSEAPVRKRFRRSEDADEETDQNKPSLKTFSTWAKLERWVSDPDNSQDLIDKLEKRIQTKGLETLKEELKNMKLKKDLCFTAKKVRDIQKNRKLKKFLQNDTNAEFPKVALDIFFQKKSKNAKMPQKDEQNDSSMCRDSGYNSLNNSHIIDPPDNNSSSESEALECMENKVAQHNEQNMSAIKPADIYGGNLHSAQGTNGTNDQTPTGREDYKSLDETTGEMQETGHKPNMHQSEQFQSTSAGTEVESRHSGPGVQMQDERDAALGKNMYMLEAAEPTLENDLGKTNVKPKIRQNPNDRKLKKMKEQHRLLYKWAKKKCSREENVEKDVEEVFGHMSFENIVEHREYPCFTAEDIMIYTDPQTQERHIIYPEEKNSEEKDTEVRVNYQMWVCDIKQAVVLMNSGEKKIQYESFDAILQRCERLVFEAFAPALAVFKNLQKQEMFFSLIKNH